jgi:hypothetical protein
MQTISVLILAALTVTTTAANAQNTPRSSVNQPSFTTCSESRQACLAGVNRRAHTSKSNPASCEKAYKTCMRTGVWDTYGHYGRRVVGVERR